MAGASAAARTPDDALAGLYAAAGHVIRRCQQIAVAVFMDETKGFSLTPVQYAALVVVRAPPGVDQTRLVELVALDRSTIGNVVERLEAKGLLARLVDINNGLSRAPPRPVAAGHKASL